MEIKKKHFCIKLLSLLLIATSDIQAANTQDESHLCGRFFYDFELKKFPEVEDWNNSVNENSYRYKKDSHLGAMLISHGFFAVPLGYGRILVINNGKCVVDRVCPSCGERYTKMESCAFNNCYFKIKGRKSNDTIIIKPWKKVEDFLLVFKDSSDLAEYTTLVIECRRLSDPPNDDEYDF